MEAARAQGNLSPAAASSRLRFSVLLLSAAMALAVVMAKADVTWAWRLLLFFPFALATNSFLQSLFRT